MAITLTEQDLRALGDLFEQSLEIENVDSFDPMPDGTYLCTVVECEVTKTKTTDKLMAKWRFKVVEGEEGAGRNIFKNTVLTDNPKNFKRFQNDLGKFGIVSDSLTSILGNLSSLVDSPCMVQLKTDDKDRQWVTISTEDLQ